ncbi:MAG: beta-galactosidase [Vallitaleaceae bacterium]|nr:beta-galactosidase [Vallitaleaceae bacterium]
MYFGVDYYPEHWPKERWETDAKMMKAANMNVVRVAEFAWSKLEPKEGVYDFTWLDEAIETLAKYDIQVIIGTPTATPPKWMMDQHPDIYPVDLYGMKKGFGTRRHYCSVNGVYRDLSRTIAQKMVEHYKDNAHVIGWQIDNEFDANCYCDHCKNGFHEWLKNKYGTIEKLNEEWGTVFWSQTYNDFDQVVIPRYSSSDGFAQVGAGSSLNRSPFNHNPGLLLDYYRYKSDAVVEYQKIQIDEIRKVSTLPITHNYMGHFSELDYFNLGKDLDFISWDCYPNNMWGKSTYAQISMAHDLMRGIKNQNFWMMEQQSGPCGWQAMGDTPEPGQVRLWSYQALAHGAEAMVYFRWRTALFGTEQYWHGILDHDGLGRRRYQEVAEIGKELKSLEDLFVGAKNVNEVALIKSYDNVWSHRVQPHNSKFDYNGLLMDYYGALINNHITTDVTSVETDFSNYKLVLMPAFNLMTEEIQSKCEAYVKKGGNLLITFRSGTKNWNNSMSTKTNPGYFKELAGIELEEYDSINFDRVVEVSGNTFKGQAKTWCDVISCKSAKVLATYGSHYYAGKPAITVNEYGQGKVYYVGCDLNEEAMTSLLKSIADDLKLEKILQVSVPNVDAVRKVKNGEVFTIVMNHNNYSVDMQLKGTYNNLLGGEQGIDRLSLKPYGVGILVE